MSFSVTLSLLPFLGKMECKHMLCSILKSCLSLDEGGFFEIGVLGSKSSCSRVDLSTSSIANQVGPYTWFPFVGSIKRLPSSSSVILIFLVFTSEMIWFFSEDIAALK
ncbi:hypothetical protein QL285_009427 [Trifolium repens]|nr:hypothetical protein QL285_009427 [Trifolium repens]